MYYKCHITLAKQECVSPIQAIEALGWKYSAIDGDPDLGEGLLEYATTHYLPDWVVTDVIDEMAKVTEVLTICGHRVIRQKVELVIYDTKGKH